MSRYLLKTFGCKANLYDSQLLEAELQKQGWTPGESRGKGRGDDDQEVDLCIINSCTVTDEADRQARKMAAKLSRENPRAKIVMTGCGAEVDPQGMAQSPGVTYVVGNQDKDSLVNLVTSHILQHNSSPQSDPSTILGSVQNYAQILSKHPTEREWPSASEAFQTPPTQLAGYSDKTRAFLKIQEGCNAFCTYCIIPYGRGPSRSLRPREVLTQIRQLVDSGVREIVITGTNIGDYGGDWSSEPALGDLLEQILVETPLERLRISSLDPTEITPQILQLMQKEPRLCAHFHVSLQSPHSRILRLMKRKYQFEQVQSCLNEIARIQAPIGGAFVGMDVITGFPGESEQDFQWTVEALQNLPWSRLHVFPYSEREGTPATRITEVVPQDQRIHRSRVLNRLSLERQVQHYRKVLDQCRTENRFLESVLLEKKGNKEWVAGYTSNYLRILISSTEMAGRNQLISVRPLDIMIDSKGNDVALVSQPV